LKILQFPNLYELREKRVKTGAGHCKVAESKEKEIGVARGERKVESTVKKGGWPMN
jgi:hypothetical protein